MWYETMAVGMGAIPVKLFFETFLRPVDAPVSLVEGLFKDVSKYGVESARYGKFIAAIQPWMPHLQAVNTSKKEDTANNLRLKTDISVYNRVDGMTPPEGTNFSRMELWMEFKSKTGSIAFQDPPNSERQMLA